MSDTAIHVESLSKAYRISHQAGNKRYKTLREDLMALPAYAGAWLRGQNTRRETFWALQDLSFDVQEGDVLGIIGRNGAGKSTLLKILSRITEPTRGRAEIYGRVGSLLEVGTGFHPELTGRENIFLSGAVLGMTRREVQSKFDEIVAFAEVERFLDTPAKHYSSGMYVRLGFSVAAHLEPEILLVDEVLAVGDLEFQNKCLGKMSEVSKSGRTVLFVSHNMGAISALTQKCIYLKSGQMAAYGQTSQIVGQYLKEALEQANHAEVDLSLFRRDPNSDSPLHFTRVWVNDLQQKLSTVEMGSDLKFSFELQVSREIRDACFTFILKDVQGQRVSVFFSWDQDFSLSLSPGKHVVGLEIHDLPLTPGDYFADFGVNQSTNTVAYEVITDLPLFKVANETQVVHWRERPWGIVHWKKAEWNVVPAG